MNEKGSNGIQKTIGIFFSPYKTIEDIKTRQNILFGIVITAILILISSAISVKISPIYQEETFNVLLDKYGVGFYNYMSNAQNKALENMSEITITITTFFSGFILSLIQYVIISGILLLVFKICKAEINFKIVFSSLIYINIVTTLLGIILLIAQYFLHTSLNIMSLAAVFMPNGNFTSLLYNLLSNISIPIIWSGILFGIFCIKTNNINKTAAIIIAIIFFILCVLIPTGLLSFQNIMYDTTYTGLKNMGII